MGITMTRAAPHSKSLERGFRSERAMTLAVAEMEVKGVSTRKVTAGVEKLCKLEVVSTQVSRVAAELDAQLSAWKNRPLGEVTSLFLDARNEKVRHGGAVVPCAVLTAIGVTPEGNARFSAAHRHIAENLAVRGKSPAWPSPANAGERWSTWATPKNAEGFRGCRTPLPAAADFIDSLLGRPMVSNVSKKKSNAAPASPRCSPMRLRC